MAIRKSGNRENGITYKVEERTILAERSGGYKLELRYMSWNGKEPKYDIRAWKETEDGEVCGKGISLSGEELEILGDYINKLRED